eukprot:351236-Chlamydomonas_euryale.AAC.8
MELTARLAACWRPRAEPPARYVGEASEWRKCEGGRGNRTPQAAPFLRARVAARAGPPTGWEPPLRKDYT